MIILDYKKSYHKQIIAACARALRAGKIVAYPTDTSYGLAADSGNLKAIRKLYRLKGRNFNKPVHVVVPSVAYAKKITAWDRAAERLARKFWPGALTLVVRIMNPRTKPPARRSVRGRQESRKAITPSGSPLYKGERLALGLKKLSASTGFLGLRMPKNQIALDLAKVLRRPITATSANQSGQADCYDIGPILKQFSKARHKPDIIINAGRLPKKKPSTVVKISGGSLGILRLGPVSRAQIKRALNVKFKTKNAKLQRKI